jgi:DNA-binding LacI/PurR family transcriptional regulator
MGRVTIKDVASMAGVSPTAVSLAMNGKPGISAATREKILQVVKQMEFTPNESSRRLLFQRTGNIALLMGGDSSLLDQSFYSELNNHLLRECERRRYNVIYCIANVDEDSSVILPNVIKSRDVDGIIVMGYLDTRIIRKIHSSGIPIMIVDNYLPEPDVCNVVFDYFQAALSAMEYLIACGHSQIGYIGSDISGNMLKFFSQQTFMGFKTVLEKYNLSMPASWMQMGARDEYTAGLEMDKMFHAKTLPTAILCSGDIYAIGAMRSIKAHGLRVPEDISVIGIDDILLSQYVEPALTTIRVDRQALANMAINLLVERIEQGKVQEQAICPGHLLIERKSVRALA